ncbi:MAG: hypothetical protein QF570_00180 [Myxococcota bacterium]|jgi:hypothetical protein|nr:hypothetical protein [Myxococcota bacterium]
MSERDDERRTAETSGSGAPEQELSELLDGELSPARAREVRQALEANPEMRERLAAFESVDAQLRDLVAPAVPDDLRARLEVRIAGDLVAGGHHAEDEHAETGSDAGWNWRLPVAAAVAAALFAGWLALPRGGEEVDIAEQEPVAPRVVPTPPDEEVAVSTPEVIAEVVPPRREETTETPGDEEASDLELAIAFELETLSDFEVIEELDLLEALLALEERERVDDGRSTS